MRRRQEEQTCDVERCCFLFADDFWRLAREGVDIGGCIELGVSFCGYVFFGRSRLAFCSAIVPAREVVALCGAGDRRDGPGPT